MTQSNLAASADYAEALLSARRAKSVVSLLLFFILAIELALFIVLRYFKPLPVGISLSKQDQYARDLMQYFVGLLDFGGLILPALLAGIVCLILHVQLAGRLIGVGRLVNALFWSFLLVLLMFPWQAVLNNPAINFNDSDNAIGMKIPGVVYTWAEVSDPWLGARFGMDENSREMASEVKPATAGDLKKDLAARSERAKSPSHVPGTPELILHWARYVVFPVLAMLILAIIHFKTLRGLRQSLGEDQISPETTTSP